MTRAGSAVDGSELLSGRPRKRCTHDGALNFVLQHCTYLADRSCVGNEGHGRAVRDLPLACVQIALEGLFHCVHLGVMQCETPGLCDVLLQLRTKALDCTTMGNEWDIATPFNFSLAYS